MRAEAWSRGADSEVEMEPKDGNNRDYPAIVVLIGALVLLLVFGILMIRDISEKPFQNPLQSLSQWAEKLQGTPRRPARAGRRGVP